MGCAYSDQSRRSLEVLQLPSFLESPFPFAYDTMCSLPPPLLTPTVMGLQWMGHPSSALVPGRHQSPPTLGAPEVGTREHMGPTRDLPRGPCLCLFHNQRAGASQPDTTGCKAQSIWLWVASVGEALHEKLEREIVGDCRGSAMPSPSSAWPTQHSPNSPPWLTGAASSTHHTPQDPSSKEVVRLSHYRGKPLLETLLSWASGSRAHPEPTTRKHEG